MFNLKIVKADAYEALRKELELVKSQCISQMVDIESLTVQKSIIADRHAKLADKFIAASKECDNYIKENFKFIGIAGELEKEKKASETFEAAAKRDITKLQKSCETLKTKISDLNETITSKDFRIQSIYKDLEEANKKNEEYAQAIKELQNKGPKFVNRSPLKTKRNAKR